MLTSQRWWRGFPFILALISLIFIGWSAYAVITYPHDGTLSLSTTGVIRELDTFGGEINQLEVGDIIVSIDGVPYRDATLYYENKQPGDTAKFVVNRDNELITLSIQLTEPGIELILSVAVVSILALVFWGMGVGVLAFKPGDITSNLFFLFTQVSALLLTSGMISFAGPGWTSNLFNFLLWVVGPVTMSLHYYFPQRFQFRHRRALLIALYTIALIGGLPYLILGARTVRSFEWYAQYYAAGLVFLTINLALVIAILVHGYQNATSPGVRSQIRIVVLGGVLSLAPIITLTLLPDVLFAQPILSYNFAFLFLGFFPLTYGYAIVRLRLIEIDRHVNRGATFILVFSILGGIYVVLYAIINLISLDFLPDALVNTILVLVMASIFPFLYRRVQRLVDTAFYGSWYDYRSAVTKITRSLEQITEMTLLARTIGDRLVSVLQLEDACVFLRDLDGSFSVIEVAPHPKPGDHDLLTFQTLPQNSLTYLLNIGAVGIDSLRETLAEVELSPEEHELLASEQIYLWVPVIGHGQVLGLLALGPKTGGDVFSGEDMDILRIVSRQMGPLIENIHLVTRLRQYAAELEKRVEERTAELFDAKERVEAVLSSVADGVVVTDLEGNILTVNQAFEEQSGYQADEAIGHSLYSLLNGHENQEKSVEIQESLQRDFHWSGELNTTKKGGRHYDVLLTITPLRNQQGEIMGYVSSQRDITQYKELERLKDQFILEVSHELRTPVTNMGLFAELLERGKPEKKEEYMRVLKTEISQLMRMIEDILDLSRLEVGKFKRTEFSDLDLNLITEQVVAAHSLLAEESGLILAFEPSENLPRIFGEQNQIARVLTNLLTNALRYTNEGFVKVKTYGDGNGAWVEVQDTGIGIDEADFPHLFERFYRGQKVSQSKIMGSGLGLAIVKEIVDLHEGKIDWESVDGEGSTFRVWFPEMEKIRVR
ncbi:MAG: PAS domain S-box protein [Chloroflexota bacterium]|nr:MAG: PAS domain S-box protein [Chloroflexota bacterium]